MLVKQYFGTGNFLSCSEIGDNSARRLLGVYDPRAVQQQLRVPALQRSVFPLVQSGVRFWPYLLVAHELRECSKTETERRLRGIRQLQRNQSYSRDFGPLQFTTFRAYRAMHDKVIVSATKDAGELRKLLSTRRRYRGQASFFINNAHQWRKALRRSMGTNSQQFARLLNRLDKKLSQLRDR